MNSSTDTDGPSAKLYLSDVKGILALAVFDSWTPKETEIISFKSIVIYKHLE